jgi:hypothetical protein
MRVTSARATSPRLAIATGCLAILLAACTAPGASTRPTPEGSSPAAAAPSAPAPSASDAIPPRPSALPSAGPASGIPAGGSWAALAVTGPAPAAREDHTWTVDPGSGLVYLFGGRDGGRSFDDLWTFDPVTTRWSELAPAGPAPAARFGHEAAWAPGVGLVITLGQAGARFFDDVWLFDPEAASWRELPGKGERPVARYGSCSGIGPDGRLWISHGFTEEGSRFFDTRAYDFDTGSWSDATPPDLQPVERCLHTCWWTRTGDFVLYGGQTTGVAALGDLWVLSGASQSRAGTWTKQDKPALAARQLPAVARRGALTIAFGGRDIDRRPLGDTWLLPDPGEPAITRLAIDGESPAPRSGAALVYDEARDRVLLFGGIGDEALDDLWMLSFD